MLEAAHGDVSGLYGWSGCVYGLSVESLGEGKKVFQAINWIIHKSKLVSNSDFGAEILFAADAEELSHGLELSFN